MDNQTKLDIASESSEAVHQFVYPFTISMLDTGKSPMELGSGTLVAIDERVFVATAKHCVPINPTGRLWIMPEQPRSTVEGMLGFIQVGKHPNLDVAFLELDPKSLADYLPTHSCCTVEQLSNEGFGRANRIIAVCGSPVQFAAGDGNKETPLKVTNLAFSTVPFARNEFPVVPANFRVADPLVDIFFEYPAEGLRLDDGTMINLDSPEGLSGGGIWDQGFETDSLWSPSGAKLIGIPSAWHPQQRYARGIQIIHWLRLIWSSVEDCRASIESAFPDESFSQL